MRDESQKSQDIGPRVINYEPSLISSGIKSQFQYYKESSCLVTQAMSMS
jgi:hypothetical protein